MVVRPGGKKVMSHLSQTWLIFSPPVYNDFPASLPRGGIHFSQRDHQDPEWPSCKKQGGQKQGGQTYTLTKMAPAHFYGHYILEWRPFQRPLSLVIFSCTPLSHFNRIFHVIYFYLVFSCFQRINAQFIRQLGEIDQDILYSLTEPAGARRRLNPKTFLFLARVSRVTLFFRLRRVKQGPNKLISY